MAANVQAPDPFLWLAPELAVDEQAYESYVELTQRNLVSFFLNRGCQNAEDLASESLLRLVKKLSESDGLPLHSTTARKQYLFGIARHVLQEWRRSPVARESALPEDEEGKEFSLPPVSLVAEQCLELMKDAVEKSLSLMSVAEREIIKQTELSADAPVTLNELARLRGTQPAAMRQRAHRARVRFRMLVMGYAHIRELLQCLGLKGAGV